MSEESAYQILKVHSRDNSRTPMQWEDAPHAGFTSGSPWIGVNPNYRRINAARQTAEPDSIFRHYQALIRLPEAIRCTGRRGFFPSHPPASVRIGLLPALEGRDLDLCEQFLSQSLLLD